MAEQMKELRKFFDMDSAERFEDLRDRVNKFNMLQLLGQPQGMHMGTSYLVGDLWHELRRFMVELKRVEVAYDADNDRTEVRYRAGEFEDLCWIEGDSTEDEERLAITDRIAALNFKRWKERRGNG